jgi:predicted Zn-dependent protease
MTPASALSGLGWAISKNGDKKNLEEAIADQKKAIKAYPGFVPAYIRMAELLHSQNKDKQAEAVYSNSLRQSGGDASIATSYAKFLAATGRKDEAKTILKKLLEKKADYKDAADALAAIENEKAK